MKRDAIETINLPGADRRLKPYHVREPRKFARPDKPFTRIAYAAAHVVADPLSDRDPWLEAAVDWDATIAYRQRLWSLGLPSPRQWTPPSAAWGWTGRHRSS